MGKVINKGSNIKTLLIADDEKHIRILYKEILEKKGYKVLLAENGQQTLSMIEKAQIDLVILDMRMPDVNGVEVLRELGTKKSHPPVLINSAYSGYMEDHHCWVAEDYIIKTSDLTELLKKIEEDKIIDFGFNALNGKFGSMTQFGILDPLKVTRLALQNAASVAMMVLTTEGLVTDLPEKENPPVGGPGMPPGGGMGY